MGNKMVSWIRHILFSAGACLILLLALEGAVRLTLPVLLGADRAEVIYAKYGMRGGPLSLDDTPATEINTLGFTKPDFSPRKSPDVFRVLTLGGSAVAGKLSSSLRDVLGQDCPKAACEVVDGGMGGAVSAQERYHLKRWLSYNPDLVIVYDGWNDMYYSHYTPERYRDQTLKMREMEENWDRPPRWLARHSALLQVLKMGRAQLQKKLGSGVAWAEIPSDSVLQVSWMGGLTEAVLQSDGPVEDCFSESYEENLKAMGREIRSRGIPAVFILQPSMSEWASDPLMLSPALQSLLNSFKPRVREDWLKAARVLVPAARRAQQQAQIVHGYPFWDFSKLEELNPDFFSDFVHLSTDGNRWMADYIIQRLKGVMGESSRETERFKN